MEAQTWDEKLTDLISFGINLKNSKVTEVQKLELINLLHEHRDVFDVENPPIDPIPGFSVDIITCRIR